MKKIFFLCLVACGHLMSFSQANKKGNFPLSKLDKGDKYVMIFAHRGDWRNAPENSLQAFSNCIDAGIDGIEIDVQETKDGQLIIMHDATVDRTTTGKGKISDLTLEQIKALKLKTGINTLTHLQVPTLEEVLLLCKGKILIHVDKWQPVREKVLALGRKYDCLNQLIFRGTKPVSYMKELFGDDLGKINYIPVVTADGNKDNSFLDDYLRNVSVAAIGVAFDKDDYSIFNRIPEMKKQGIRVWYNSLFGKKFNAGHDDELAIKDMEKSYGWLLNNGANIIMTDRPFLLLKYLEKNNRR